MESLYNFNMNQILAFALILLRMTGFIVAMPIIGTVNVPTVVKALLPLAMTFILYPQIGWAKLGADIEQLSIVTLAMKEMFIGLSFGFLARLFFMAVTMTGEMISISLGISASQLFNPMMGETSTALDQFYLTLASLFFLAINGHHILISGIYKSFDLVPLTQTSISFVSLQSMGDVVQKVTEIAVKMSAPIMVTILFINVAIAVVGRAVPQINILITSLPINILCGLSILFIVLPLLIYEMHDLVEVSAAELFKYVRAF